MTAETTRAELFEAMRELGTLFPDWRMGQTLSNLAMAAGHVEAGAVWNLEDAEALAAARRLIERNGSRRTNPSNDSLPPAGTTISVSASSENAQATPAAERQLG